VSTIRLARPELGDEEIAAVARVLASGMLVQGREVEAFEAAVAHRCGRAHGIAVSSGTAALELALRALDVAGGEVLVPDLTWPSPAHAVELAGATPVLVDVDAREWNAGAASLAAGRSSATRAAIVIDQFGVPARHAEIAAALESVPVIEDAACAIGSTTEGRACGSFGVISCLSFHPRKVITTGEGGICLTDDARLADALRTLRNHGQRAPGEFAVAGPNLRLTEMQAAMGRVQLAKLDAIVAARRALGDRYRAGLPRDVEAQALPEGAARNEQTFGVVLPARASRDAVIAAMKREEIEVGRLSYALHTLPSLRGARAVGTLEVSSSIVARGIALPLHGGMGAADVDRVLSALERAIGAS
jgi:perosamine synthetase